jgi:hypothetical protein
MIRSVAAVPILEGMGEAPARAERPISLGRRLARDGRPIWIHIPIAEAERLSPILDLPEYCEALRCQAKRRKATTFHAVIGSAGEADYVWVACADCTGLMIEGTCAT